MPLIGMPRFHKDSVLARTVCQSRQQTTVFEGAPVVSGSAAVLLGDVDNDPQAERELAVGGVDGTLAVFKVGHPTPGPYFMASGMHMVDRPLTSLAVMLSFVPCWVNGLRRRTSILVCQ